MSDGFDAPAPGSGEPARAASLAVGTDFGPYRLEALVGTGGWTSVYRAVDTRTGYHLALKVWSSTRSVTEMRARAWALAERAHRLDRLTNINVHDVGEVGGVPYIAYRTLLAASLADLIEEHGPLEPALALGVVRAAATVLDAAHTNAEWHGNCGPANVLVDNRDLTSARVYVSDFGVAPDTVLDRDPYSAPEFNLGRAFDGRADVYSLAATYFYALTGTPPVGPTWIEGEYEPWHEGEPARRLRGLRADLPVALDELLAAALDSRADRRPRTPTELVRAIDAAWSTPDPTFEESGDDEPAPSRTGPKYSRLLIGGVVAAFVVAIGAGALVATLGSDGAPTTTTAAPPDPATLATERLTALAPSGVACQPSALGDGAGEVARVSCSTPVGRMTLVEFVSEQAMAESFAKRTSLLSNTTSGAGKPDEECTKAAVHPWTTSRDRAKAGEYLCDASDGQNRVDFTGDKAQVWGYIESDSDSPAKISRWFLDTMKPQLERATRPPTPTTTAPKRGTR